MTVYVDPCRWPLSGVLHCNIWADSVGELHAATQLVGIPYAAFQRPPTSSWFHYFGTPAERALLIRRGAVATDIYGPSEFNARRLGDSEHLRAVAQIRAAGAAGPQQAPTLHPRRTK